MVLVSSLMDSKGDVRHFFGVLFGWHGLESCCCSRDLEGVSSAKGLEARDSSSLVHPAAVRGIWKGCCPMVLGAGESSVTAFRSYCFGPSNALFDGAVLMVCTCCCCIAILYIFFNGFQR